MSTSRSASKIILHQLDSLMSQLWNSPANTSLKFYNLILGSRGWSATNATERKWRHSVVQNRSGCRGDRGATDGWSQTEPRSHPGTGEETSGQFYLYYWFYNRVSAVSTEEWIPSQRWKLGVGDESFCSVFPVKLWMNNILVIIHSSIKNTIRQLVDWWFIEE